MRSKFRVRHDGVSGELSSVTFKEIPCFHTLSVRAESRVESNCNP